MDEEEAIYPDIGAKLPGVTLDEDDMDAVVTDADNNLLHMAAWAFDNAGNNPNQRVHAVRENAAVSQSPPAEASAGPVKSYSGKRSCEGIFPEYQQK